MFDASREVFGEIPRFIKILFYISASVSVVFFCAGSWLRFSLWMKGRDDPNDVVSQSSVLDLMKMSLLYFFSPDCLLARRVWRRSRIRALMLISVYWGFTILFFGTVILAIDYDAGLQILKGKVYLWYSLTLDIAGAFLLFGCAFFLLRRYVVSRKTIVSGWDDALVLLLLFTLALSGFCIEGARLMRLDPPLMDFSPIGAFFARTLCYFISESSSLALFYQLCWILHAFLALFFIAYLPFSKQFHMFAAQITTLEASVRQSTLMGVNHE